MTVDPEALLAAEARALWGTDQDLEVSSLPHNRANGVTQSIDRVTCANDSAVVKVIGRRTDGVPRRWLPSGADIIPASQRSFGRGTHPGRRVLPRATGV